MIGSLKTQIPFSGCLLHAMPTMIPRKIIHIDMDAFYASVELREQPQLRGKPVVVAWDGTRSVICAASHEARKYGLRSAMAVATAKRLCPHAIFIPPQFALYRQVSQQIHQIFRLKPLQNPNGSLKLKMERRRLVAKLLIKYRITDFPRCRRAANIPSVTGFAKVSGCLWAMATVHKAINIKAA